MIPSRRKNKQEITSTRTKSLNKVNKELKELVLPGSKLRFCTEQLQNLNFIVTRRIVNANEVEINKPILIARSVTERLIQRLLCTVGLLDPRFSSKYLVVLHDQTNDNFSRNMEYIVRLDALSVPLLYSKDKPPQYVITEGGTEMCPHGYGRLRFIGETAKKWSEFLNSSGFLRRDKVQAKMVALLAAAASKQGMDSPNDIDESTLCGCPGKVVDPVTLHHILKVPADRHVYHGPAGNYPRFPDPRDFRLAIVDEPSGIRLRIGFLSPAIASVNIEVRLLVAIEVDSWPSTSDFPFRIPLWHADSLLFYRSAQTGMYLVGYGIQSSAWQIRLPGAEQTLRRHHGPHSTVSALLKTLDNILTDIYSKYSKDEISYKILNKYILQTCVFFELEKDSFPPTEILINWSPRFLSTLVLQILDDLIICLRSQFLPNYFFKSSNLLANPGHLSEDDYNMEVNKVKAYMLTMFDESLTSLKTDKEYKKFLNSQNAEMVLLMKWRNLVDGLMPPMTSKGTKMCFSGSKNNTDVAYSLYSSRQLESVGIVLKNVLLVKEKLLQATQETPFNINTLFVPENPTDDIIYILVTLMEQARDQFIETALTDQEMLKNLSKMKVQFDTAMTKLVEMVRRDKDIHAYDLCDDKTIVKLLLKWLHKGLEQNKKKLAPVLKPYLKNIFIFSNSLSWHLDEIIKKEYKDELEAIGSFAKLVNYSKISPAQGLVDSINKNWNWAKNMLCNVENSQLRLVFCPSRGKTVRHILCLPINGKTKEVDDHATKTLNTIKQSVLRNGYQTLPSKGYFTTLSTKDKNLDQIMPQHCVLRNSSPMLQCLTKIHRNGDHRCAGDLIQSFISLQKVSIFQEISSSLPLDERLEVLDSVHQVLNERNKKNSYKSRSHSLGGLGNCKFRCGKAGDSLGLIQKYIPKEESAGIRIDDDTSGNNGDDYVSKNETNDLIGKNLIKNGNSHKIEIKGNSLIGSCRAARIREDSNVIYLQDSFKVQSLSKRPSFKY